MRCFSSHSSICASLLVAVALSVACSDDAEEDTTTTSRAATTGAGTSTSSAQTSTGAMTTGAGGAGGSGGEGGRAFGACHGFTDDFTGFDPASTTDPWEADGMAAAFPTPDPAVDLTVPPSGIYSGLFTAAGIPATNCFTSVRLEDPSPTGLVVLEVLEGTRTEPQAHPRGGRGDRRLHGRQHPRRHGQRRARRVRAPPRRRARSASRPCPTRSSSRSRTAGAGSRSGRWTCRRLGCLPPRSSDSAFGTTGRRRFSTISTPTPPLPERERGAGPIRTTSGRTQAGVGARVVLPF